METTAVRSFPDLYVELQVVRRNLDALSSWRLTGPLDQRSAHSYWELCRAERELLGQLAAQKQSAGPTVAQY